MYRRRHWLNSFHFKSAVHVIQSMLLLIVSCWSFIGLSNLAFILHVSRIIDSLFDERLKRVFCNSEINIISYEMFVISVSPVSNVTVCSLKDPDSIHEAEPEVSQTPCTHFTVLMGLTCALQKLIRRVPSMLGNKDSCIHCWMMSSFRCGEIRSSLLWYVTQRWLVVRYWRFGTFIGPSLKGQADPWRLSRYVVPKRL
jgi:hypothetical protein